MSLASLGSAGALPYRAVSGSGSVRRRDWEGRWQAEPGEHFVWHLEEVPPRLRSLLESDDLPTGAALDVGCGDGVVATHLARRFRPSVGIDIALGAAVQGRQRAAKANAPAEFLVGDAAGLSLRDGSIALIFDRGCLQNMPRAAWPSYFLEVERVLVPGGVLQLSCSRAARSFPPVLSRRGLKARVKWFRGHRPGPQFASPQLIRDLAPPALAVEVLEEVPMRMRNGNMRVEIAGTLRKGSEGR